MKLKVLYIIPSLGRGGAERLLLDLCQELKSSKEVEAKIVTLSDINLFAKEYPELDVTSVKITFNLSIFKKDHVDLSQLDQVIDSFQPDVIHSHVFYADLIAHYHVKKNIKYVSHIHGRTTQLEPFPAFGYKDKRSYTFRFEQKLILKKYAKANTQFIAVSQFYKNYFLKNTGLDASRVQVIHNAINLAKFQPPVSKKQNERIELVSIGRLEEVKGQDFLIRVMALLKETEKSIHLHILGEGSKRKELEDLALSLGISEQVTLTGNVDNPEEYLQSGDVYIHGAVDEPFGLVLIEAMACGIPVVTTDAGGSTELIHNGENALLVQERSVEKYAQTVLHLLKNQGLQQDLRDNALLFSRNFGIDNYANQLTNYYKSLLSL